MPYPKKFSKDEKKAMAKKVAKKAVAKKKGKK
jgi:hypothetical protein